FHPFVFQRRSIVNIYLPWKITEAIGLCQSDFFRVGNRETKAKFYAGNQRVVRAERVTYSSDVLSETARANMPRTKRGLVHGHVKDIATNWARERPDLDPVDYLLPIYLIRMGRIVDRMGDHRWQKRFGLSSSEIRVLFALRRSGGEYARRPTDLF